MYHVHAGVDYPVLLLSLCHVSFTFFSAFPKKVRVCHAGYNS